MSGSHCLFCRAEKREPLTFLSLLSPDTSTGFCLPCQEQLDRIDPQCSCRLCGRDLRSLEPAFVHDQICHDCIRWKQSGRNGLYGRNYAIYSYNAFIKEVMNAFKFRGDAILADGFEKELKKAYSRIIDHRLRFRFLNLRSGGEYEAIVPIPLSRERLVERGFNQAELLARKLGQPIVDALIREKNEQKQSKKNRRERLLMRETPFHLKDDHVRIVTGKKILLVDDLYTTGATMRLAATALTAAHPKQIDSLTLIHG